MGPETLTADDPDTSFMTVGALALCGVVAGKMAECGDAGWPGWGCDEITTIFCCWLPTPAGVVWEVRAGKRWPSGVEGVLRGVPAALDAWNTICGRGCNRQIGRSLKYYVKPPLADTLL